MSESRNPKIANPRLNSKGEEVANPNPITIPINLKRPKSITQQVREALRSERLKEYANQNGYETPEEADDFEIGDDYDPRSPYEENFDHVNNFEQVKTAFKPENVKKRAQKKAEKAEKKTEPKKDSPE